MKKPHKEEMKFLDYLNTHDSKDRCEHVVVSLFGKEICAAAVEHQNADYRSDYGYPIRNNLYDLTPSGYNVLINYKSTETNKKIGIATLLIAVISLLVAVIPFFFKLFY